MKKRVDLILNGKGGVGKSFFAVNFVQFLKDRHIAHVAIDTDNENSTLKRFHREAEFIDLNRPAGLDLIFHNLDKPGLVVVDCRSASTEIFLDYVAELDLFEVLHAADAELTIVSPICQDSDSLEQIRTVADRFNDRCRYVIVRNHCISEFFIQFDQSKTRTRLLGELNAREIFMPKLYDWLVAELNREDLTITPALQHPAFSILDRQRLKHWQEIFNDQIDSVADFLLPPDTTPAQMDAASPVESTTAA